MGGRERKWGDAVCAHGRARVYVCARALWGGEGRGGQAQSVLITATVGGG